MRNTWWLLAVAACAGAEEPAAGPPGGAPPPAAPSPAAPDPAPPAAAFHISPSAEILEKDGKHLLKVVVDTDLPAQTIVEIYLKRRQFSSDGQPTSKLVESWRFTIQPERPARFDIQQDSLLSQSAYDVEVVCDTQRQYPGVQEKLKGVDNPRASCVITVGSAEEIALEHEWGEKRVVGALRRFDAAFEALGKKEAWADHDRRLGWVIDRLGKVGAASPGAEVPFPRAEEGLKALCGRLRELAAGSGNPVALAGLPGERDLVERTYAGEFTGSTLSAMSHWLKFVHQEYWLNRIYKRLSKDEWEGFKKSQSERLRELDENYTGYATSEEPVRQRIAKLFPPYVKDAAAALHEVQDAYDADLAAERDGFGPASGAAMGRFNRILAQAGMTQRRR